MNISSHSVRRGFVLVAIAIAATVATRLLVYSSYRNTALFYILLPYLISLAIYWSARHSGSERFARQSIGEHLAEAAAVFCAIALFMLEGFVCVLFAAPIYFVVVTVGYLTSYSVSGIKHRLRNRIGAYAVPVMALVLSLEGVSGASTFDRQNQVTYTATADAGIDELKANMAKPIAFDQPRQWFISLFPAPVSVEAGSLNAGDIHSVRFVYKKWFFTNFHEGEMRIRIDAVDDTEIRTTIVENSSYLASYMAIDGTRIRFSELGSGQTRISLTLYYRRNLDPAWYFGPLQRLAMKQSARYLVETVIARRALDG